jgi:membrane glycosyltransferase
MVIAVIAVIVVVVVAFGSAVVGKCWLRSRGDKARRERRDGDMPVPLEHRLVIPGEEPLTGGD